GRNVTGVQTCALPIFVFFYGFRLLIGHSVLWVLVLVLLVVEIVGLPRIFCALGYGGVTGGFHRGIFGVLPQHIRDIQRRVVGRRLLLLFLQIVLSYRVIVIHRLVDVAGDAISITHRT